MYVYTYPYINNLNEVMPLGVTIFTQSHRLPNKTPVPMLGSLPLIPSQKRG